MGRAWLVKFRENATLARDNRALQALEDAVLTLDDQADMTKVLAPLSLAQLADVRVAAAGRWIVAPWVLSETWARWRPPAVVMVAPAAGV